MGVKLLSAANWWIILFWQSNVCEKDGSASLKRDREDEEDEVSQAKVHAADEHSEEEVMEEEEEDEENKSFWDVEEELPPIDIPVAKSLVVVTPPEASKPG